MAKLYKVEMYILDINDCYKDLDEIMIETECAIDEASFNSFNVESVELEWEDDIDLNYTNATVGTYRKYFKEEKIGS